MSVMRSLIPRRFLLAATLAGAIGLSVVISPVVFAWNRNSPTSQSSHANDALNSRIKRTELERASSSVPGRDIVQVRTEIPARVESGWHTHPGDEVGYIVAGKVDMAIKGRSTLHLQAGDGFLIPPGVPHNALDIGPETGIMLSTYFVVHGLPLITRVAEE